MKTALEMLDRMEALCRRMALMGGYPLLNWQRPKRLRGWGRAGTLLLIFFSTVMWTPGKQAHAQVNTVERIEPHSVAPSYTVDHAVSENVLISGPSPQKDRRNKRLLKSCMSLDWCGNLKGLRKNSRLCANEDRCRGNAIRIKKVLRKISVVRSPVYGISHTFRRSTTTVSPSRAEPKPSYAKFMATQIGFIPVKKDKGAIGGNVSIGGVGNSFTSSAPQHESSPQEAYSSDSQNQGECRYGICRSPLPKGFWWWLLAAYGVGSVLTLAMFRGAAWWDDRQRKRRPIRF